jgi:hypothetical protein
VTIGIGFEPWSILKLEMKILTFWGIPMFNLYGRPTEGRVKYSSANTFPRKPLLFTLMSWMHEDDGPKAFVGNLDRLIYWVDLRALILSTEVGVVGSIFVANVPIVKPRAV